MKLNVRDIGEAGRTVELAESVADLDEKTRGLGYVFLSPLRARLEVTRSGADVCVRGTMTVVCSLVCSRCTETFPHTVDAGLSRHFKVAVPAPSGRKGAGGGGRRRAGDVELGPRDVETAILEGDELDLTELVVEQLALELPIQPLCSEECKGLCPVCGADRNRTECGCAAAGRVDPRFAVLERLRKK